jgi:hypothetical protein
MCAVACDSTCRWNPDILSESEPWTRLSPVERAIGELFNSSSLPLRFLCMFSVVLKRDRDIQEKDQVKSQVSIRKREGLGF